MNALELTRLCAWYMNEICTELGLANQAIHWSGEDPDSWIVVNDHHVKALDGHHLVAELFFNGPLDAEIVVPDNYRLIRNEHLSEYDPIHYGIKANHIKDFKGDTEPDLVINYTPEEMPYLLQGPRQHLPQRTMKRKPRVRRSYEPGARNRR